MCYPSSTSLSPTRTAGREESQGQSQDRFAEQAEAQAAAGGEASSKKAPRGAAEAWLDGSEAELSTKACYGRELLLLFRVETKDPDVQLPIRTIRLPGAAVPSEKEHDDEKLISDLETRLFREDGFDERNAETFPDSHSSDGWSYEEAIEANEALLAQKNGLNGTKVMLVLSTSPAAVKGANCVAVKCTPSSFKPWPSTLKPQAPGLQTKDMNADAPAFNPNSTLLKADAPVFTPVLQNSVMRSDAPSFEPSASDSVDDTEDCSQAVIASDIPSTRRSSLEVLSTTPGTQTFLGDATMQSPYMHSGLVLGCA